MLSYSNSERLQNTESMLSYSNNERLQNTESTIDKHGFNITLSELDFNGFPQLSSSAISTTSETLSQNIYNNALEIDKVARRREQNRRAQRRHREKKKEKQLERAANNGSTSLVDSHNSNYQDLVGQELLQIQRYHNSTNPESLEAFPDEHVIFMSSYNINRAFSDIVKSINRVIPSFKLDLHDGGLISPLNSITLSHMAKNNLFPIADTISESASPSLPPVLYVDSDSMASRWTEALDRLPSNLRPTQLQLSIPHHPMIDVIPWPSVRDKLMITYISSNTFRCYQKLPRWFRLWGKHPELDDNWEITPASVQEKWFLFDKDIVKRTNWWRSQRSLPPIEFDVVLAAHAPSIVEQQTPPISIQK